MIWTILSTIAAVVFFVLAKRERDSKGSVRNCYTLGFIVFVLAALFFLVFNLVF